jgi:hypothetical protein
VIDVDGLLFSFRLSHGSHAKLLVAARQLGYLLESKVGLPWLHDSRRWLYQTRNGDLIATSQLPLELVTMTQMIELTLQVTSPVQADELRVAWHEIVSGQKYAHAEALDYGLEAIMDRARTALQVIETPSIQGRLNEERVLS